MINYMQNTLQQDANFIEIQRFLNAVRDLLKQYDFNNCNYNTQRPSIHIPIKPVLKYQKGCHTIYNILFKKTKKLHTNLKKEMG